MPSLTLREQMLVLAVLAAVLIGIAVKHWRDERRDARPMSTQRSTEN